MTHPLKSLDKDGVLPKKVEYWHSKLGYPENCVDAHNKAINKIESIGVEVDVEALANMRIKTTCFDGITYLVPGIEIAHAIANSPEVLRLVRMKEEK